MLNTGDIIGYFTLAEDKVFDIPQEYAGAKTEVKVPAGRYPVTYDHTEASGWRHCMFGCKLPGIVTYDFFWNRIGAHGSAADRSGEIGKERTHHLHWCNFSLDNGRFHHPIELLEGIVLDHIDDYAHGEPMMRINHDKSEGLDPALETMPPEVNPEPGSEYLRGFQE